MTPATFVAAVIGAGFILCAAAYAIQVAYDCSPRFRDWLERVLPEGGDE